jgi:hypothetical protein
VYSIWLSLSCVGSGSSGSSSVFRGVLMVEESDGVGDRWLGDTITVDVHTLLEAFFDHFPDICPFHCSVFFLRFFFPQMPDYQDFQILRCQMREVKPCLCFYSLKIFHSYYCCFECWNFHLYLCAILLIWYVVFWLFFKFCCFCLDLCMYCCLTNFHYRPVWFSFL